MPANALQAGGAGQGPPPPPHSRPRSSPARGPSPPPLVTPLPPLLGQESPGGPIPVRTHFSQVLPFPGT